MSGQDKAGPSRMDAAAIVTGTAPYVADLQLDGLLCAKVLRSPHPHARIRQLDARRARAAPGVHAVITGADLTGLSPRFLRDQQVMATDIARYRGDIVAAVAADDEASALRALATIEVGYEPLPAVATTEQALAPDAPVVGGSQPAPSGRGRGPGTAETFHPRRNVSFEFSFETGDPRSWEDCDHIFDDVFVFSRMNQFHLEPFVAVASAVGDDIDVWSSNQKPFLLRKDLAELFGWPEERFHVHVQNLGGGFGAKSNFRTEPIAVLLSVKTGRPVRLCYTTEEQMLTNSQHSAVIRVRAGVRADGTFVARKSEVLLNAGAYTGNSPQVAEKAGYRMPGAYRWQRIESRSACVLTNTTPAGAFRGFGGPQATWASESQVDMIARRLNIDPFELRMRNLKDLGEPFVPGDSGLDSDLRYGLNLVADQIGYHERDRGGRRGIGLAIGVKDAGGLGKLAEARVCVSATGEISLFAGTVEMGQGSSTALCQIAADMLGVPLDLIRYRSISTDVTPYDQGTNASSGTTVMGTAVQRAVRAVADLVAEFAESVSPGGSVSVADWTVRGLAGGVLPLAPLVAERLGPSFQFTGTGSFKAPAQAGAPLGFQCLFWEVAWTAAEVEVDPETGHVHVLRLVVSGDAGHAVNELACRGQDEGSAVMGLGQALFEEMRFDETTLLNLDSLDYRVPHAADLPAQFWSITQEQGHGPGPFGLKGLGEGSILTVAAAIANAVDDAVGVRVTTLPITPQRVWEQCAQPDRLPSGGRPWVDGGDRLAAALLHDRAHGS